MLSGAHLAEFGIVAPVGCHGVEQLLGVAADSNDKRLPEVARVCVTALGAQLRMLKAQILLIRIAGLVSPIRQRTGSSGKIRLESNFVSNAQQLSFLIKYSEKFTKIMISAHQLFPRDERLSKPRVVQQSVDSSAVALRPVHSART
jgi:hypothetical protein